MKTQQAVTPDHLEQLLCSPPDGPLISLILPMESRGPETRQNSIRLKSALKRVRALLTEQQVESEEIEKILAPAEKLEGNEDFWQHQESTLALYLGRNSFHPFVLMSSFDEYISVGPRFHVTPLLYTLRAQPEAFVLVLSQNEVALYRHRLGELQKLSVKDLPTDKESALLLDPEKQIQQHVATNSRARGAPVYGVHGQGGAKDQRLGHLTDFFHKVEAAVTHHLEGKKHPLFLATVEENEALYRQINGYQNLAVPGLRGNFDRISLDEIQRQLADRLEGEAQEAARETCARVTDAVAAGSGTAEIDEALLAASEGRVGDCVVALDAPVQTGEWKPEERHISHDKEPTPHHADLVGTVAAESWLKGGAVHFAIREALPKQASVAVAYRFTP